MTMPVTAPDLTRDWWPELLTPGGSIPPIALLLARHPDAAEMTEHLLEDLTVDKLAAIASVMQSRCRLMAIPDHLCEETRAQMAWDLLHSGLRRPVRPPDPAWTDTAELLALAAARASQDPIAELRHAPIHRLIAVCDRIVLGPYRACTDG